MASIIKSNTYADFNGREILTANNDGVLTTQKINYPAWSVYLTANQSVPNTTITKINLDAKIFDTNNVFDTSTNYNATIPSGMGGKYFIQAYAFIDDVDDGEIGQMQIFINDTQQTAPYLFDQITAPAGSTNVFLKFSGLINLNAGDTADLRLYHNKGSASNARGNQVRFSGFRIGS